MCRDDAAETLLAGWIIRTIKWTRDAWAGCGPGAAAPQAGGFGAPGR